MHWQNINSIGLCENFNWVLDAKQNGMNMELQVGLGEGVSPAAATDLIARLEFPGAQLSLWSSLWTTRGLTRVGVCFVIWIQSSRKLSRRFVKAVSSMWSLWKAIPQPCLLCLVFYILSISLQPIQASRPYLFVGGVRGSELRGGGSLGAGSCLWLSAQEQLELCLVAFMLEVLLGTLMKLIVHMTQNLCATDDNVRRSRFRLFSFVYFLVLTCY